ncbi:MAG: HEAT repeat domain-containing protein [Granulosicoccus sp.]
MKLTVVLLVVVSAIVVIGLWPAGKNAAPDTSSRFAGDDASVSSPAGSHVKLDSPFEVADSDSTKSDSKTNTVGADQPASLEPVVTSMSNEPDSALWGLSLTDAQLSKLVIRLNADPALLQQLIDEFRQESDPERKRRLAIVLGAVEGEQPLLLASELIFSGDREERALGMRLLQDIQPGNAQARDVAAEMLSSEVEPDVLVGAMAALSNPGAVDINSRAYLSDQLAWLTSHQDDGVRSISLDILSRWSEDGRYTDTLLAGLDDASEYVRASAAYSLSGHEDSSPIVIERLFRTLRNGAETKRVRRAAVQALRSMPLSSDQQVELDTLERVLNTVPR